MKGGMGDGGGGRVGQAIGRYIGDDYIHTKIVA